MAETNSDDDFLARLDALDEPEEGPVTGLGFATDAKPMDFREELPWSTRKLIDDTVGARQRDQDAIDFRTALDEASSQAETRAKAPGYKGIFGESWGVLTPEESQQEVARRQEGAQRDTRIARGVGEMGRRAEERYRAQAPGEPLNPLVAQNLRLTDEAAKRLTKEAADDTKRYDEMARGKRQAPILSTSRALTENVAGGFIDLAASITKGVAAGVGFAGEYLGADTAPDQNTLYSLGRWTEAKAKELFPADEARQKDFSQKLARGAGSMIGFYGPAIIGRLAGASPSVLLVIAGGSGAAATGSETFDDATRARKQGIAVTDAQRFYAYAGGLLLGTSEAAPIATFLRGAGRYRALAAIQQSLEEGGQEAGQQLGQNALRKFIYDPNQSLTEGVDESFRIGATLGFGMGGAMHRRQSERTEQDTAPTAEPATAASTQTAAAPPIAPDARPLAASQPGGPERLAPSQGQVKGPRRADPVADAVETALGEIESETRAPAAAQAAPAVAQADAAARVPTFDQVRDVLPRDIGGDPDVVALAARVTELGKSSWAELTPQEKTAVYRSYASEGPIADSNLAGGGSSPDLATQVAQSETAAPGMLGMAAEQSVHAQPQSPARKRLRREPKPVSIVDFLRARGGLRDEGGDLRAMDARRRPGLLNRNGLDLDKARELAVEAGYLQEVPDGNALETSTADLLDLISEDLAGRRVYSQADADRVANLRAEADAAIADERHAAYIDQIEGWLAENGLAPNLSPAELDRAAILVADGLDIDSAIERVIFQSYEQEAEHAADERAASSGGSGLAGEIGSLVERIGEALAGQPSGDIRDVGAESRPADSAGRITDAERQRFTKVLASKERRANWAAAANVAEQQLARLVEEAVADGRLTLRKGEPVRTPKARIAPAAPTMERAAEVRLDRVENPIAFKHASAILQGADRKAAVDKLARDKKATRAVLDDVHQAVTGKSAKGLKRKSDVLDALRAYEPAESVAPVAAPAAQIGAEVDADPLSAREIDDGKFVVVDGKPMAISSARGYLESTRIGLQRKQERIADPETSDRQAGILREEVATYEADLAEIDDAISDYDRRNGTAQMHSDSYAVRTANALADDTLREHYDRLARVGIDQAAFDRAIARIENDRRLTPEDRAELAEAFVGAPIYGDPVNAMKWNFNARKNQARFAELRGVDVQTLGSNLRVRETLNGDALVRQLEDMAERLPSEVAFVIRSAIHLDIGGRVGSFEGLTTTPKNAREWFAANPGVAERVLAVSLEYGPDVALKAFTHEEIHALREVRALLGSEWTILEGLTKRRPKKPQAEMLLNGRRARGQLSAKDHAALIKKAGRITYREIYQIDATYNDFVGGDESMLVEETVAHIAADWADGHDFGGKVDQILTKIHDFIEALRNALNGLGFRSANDIFESIWAGEVARQHEMRVAEHMAAMMAADQAMQRDGLIAFGSTIEGTSFAIAGENAMTADREALARAKRMEERGQKREAIWAKTGWYRGVDGRWRFEIDDSKAKLRAFGPDQSMLPIELTHDALFDAYPQLHDVEYNRVPGRGGGYMDAGIRPAYMNVGKDTRSRRSVTLHESQHALQDIEGFAEGGSPANFTAADIAREQARMMSRPASNDWTSIDNIAPDDETSIRFNLYQRLAGEVEARMVQTRLEMTPQERKERAPWHDYDVPEAEQIVIMPDGLTRLMASEEMADQPRRNAEGYELTLPFGDVWGDPRFNPADRERALVRLKEIQTLKPMKASWAELNQAFDDIHRITSNLLFYRPGADLATIASRIGGDVGMYAFERKYGPNAHHHRRSLFSAEDLPAEVQEFAQEGKAALEHLLRSRRASISDLVGDESTPDPRLKGERDPGDVGEKLLSGFYFKSARALDDVPDGIFPQGGWAVINHLRQSGVRKAEVDHFQLAEKLGNEKPVTREAFQAAINERAFDFRRKTSWLNPERSPRDYEFGGTRAFTGPRIPGRGTYFERLIAFPKKLRGGETFAPGMFQSPHWQEVHKGTWGSWRGSERDLPGFGKTIVGEEGQSDYMQGALGRGDDWTGRRPRISTDEYLALKSNRPKFQSADGEAQALLMTALRSLTYDARRELEGRLLPSRIKDDATHEAWDQALADARSAINTDDRFSREPSRVLDELMLLDKLAALRTAQPEYFAPGAFEKYARTEENFTPESPIDDNYVRVMVRDLLLLAGQRNADSIAISTSETTNRIQANTVASAAHFYDSQLKPALERELRTISGDASLTLQEIKLPKAQGVPRNEKPFTVWVTKLPAVAKTKIQSDGLTMFAVRSWDRDGALNVDAVTPILYNALKREVDDASRTGDIESGGALPDGNGEAGAGAPRAVGAGPDSAGRARRPIGRDLFAAGFDALARGRPDLAPDAIDARRVAQGFTVKAWHGTLAPAIDKVDPFRAFKDFGFHVALNEPHAANMRLGFPSSIIDRLYYGFKQFIGDPKDRALVGGNLIPLYIKAEKPLRMPDTGDWTMPGSWLAGLRRIPRTPQVKALIEFATRWDALPATEYGWHDFSVAMASELERHGFDGVIYRNRFEGIGKDSLFVWKPEQVRSAYDTFDDRAVGRPEMTAGISALEEDLRPLFNEALRVSKLSDRTMFAARDWGHGRLGPTPPTQSAKGEIPELNKILGELQKSLGMTVSQGLWGVTLRQGKRSIRVRPASNVLGQTDRATGNVSVRESRDMKTIAHEGGHHVEALLGTELDALKAQYAKELAGQPTTSGQELSEAFADWFRSYVLDRAAAEKQAPNFTKAFRDLLEAERTDLLTGLDTVADEYQAWAAAAPIEQVTSGIVSQYDNNAFAELRGDAMLDNVSSWLSTGYQGVVDALHPLQQGVRYLLKIADANGIRDAQGRPISLKASEDAYKLMRMFAGSYNRGRVWLESGVSDLVTGQTMGPSLKAAVEAALGGTRWSKKRYEQFNQYLVSIRALEEYNRLEEKELALARYDSLAERIGDARRVVSGSVSRDQATLERREEALIRASARRSDRRRALGTAQTNLNSIQRRMDEIRADIAEADEVFGIAGEIDSPIATNAANAQYRNLRGRRVRSLQMLERDQRRVLRDVEALTDGLAEFDLEASMLENEIEQLSGKIDAGRQRLDQLDEMRTSLRKERDATATRGASKAPTLEPKSTHERVVAELASPEFQQAADMVHAFAFSLLQVRHQAGFLNDELFDELSKRRDWYVPFYRDLSDVEGASAMFPKTGSKRWTKFKKFNGSDRGIMAPLEILSQEAYTTAQQIAFNDVVKALVNLAETVGPGGGAIAERLARTDVMDPSQENFDKIKDIAIGLGIDPVDAHLIVQRAEMNFSDSDVVKVILSPENLGPKAKPTLPLWEGGERVMVRLPNPDFAKAMFDAINAVGAEQQDIFVGFFGKSASALRVGVTTSLDFIGANFYRDAWAAWKVTGAAPILTHIRGARIMLGKGDVAGIPAEDFQRRYNEAGGIAGGINVNAQAAQQQRDVRDLLGTEINWKSAAGGAAVGGAFGAGVVGILGGAAGFLVGGPVGGIAGAALAQSVGFTAGAAIGGYAGRHGEVFRMVESVETAARLGVAAHAYKRAIAYNPDLTQSEAILQAAFDARDYLDWNRRGSKMLVTARAIPFLLSYVNGMTKNLQQGVAWGARGSGVARQTKRKLADVLQRRTGIVWKHQIGDILSADEQAELAEAYMSYARLVGLTMILLSIMAAGYVTGDDDYDDIRDSTKAREDYIKINGVWVRLPVPFELAFVAKATGIMFDKMRGGDDRVLQRLGATAYELLAPPTMMTGISLISGTAFNARKDGWASESRPVVSPYLMKLPPHERFDAYTSQVSTDFAQALFNLGLPADKIPAPKKIDFVLTTLGGHWGREAMSTYENAKTAAGLNERPAKRATDIPVVRRFIGDAARQSRAVDEFWKMNTDAGGEMTIAANGYRQRLDMGDPAGASVWLGRLEPEQRIYALTQYHGSPSEKREHPLNRLDSLMEAVRDVQQDIVRDTLATKQRQGRRRVRDFEQEVKLTPQHKTEIIDTLTRLAQIEARNTMVLLKRDGFRHLEIKDPKLILDELKASSPIVAEHVEDVMRRKKLADWSDVEKVWPEYRTRVLREGAEAF